MFGRTGIRIDSNDTSIATKNRNLWIDLIDYISKEDSTQKYKD